MSTSDPPPMDHWWLVSLCPFFCAVFTVAVLIEAVYISFTETPPDTPEQSHEEEPSAHTTTSTREISPPETTTVTTTPASTSTINEEEAPEETPFNGVIDAPSPAVRDADRLAREIRVRRNKLLTEIKKLDKEAKAVERQMRKICPMIMGHGIGFYREHGPGVTKKKDA